MGIAGYAIALAHYPRMREIDTTLFNAGLLLGLWVLGRLAASWSQYRKRTLLLEYERGQAEERAAVRERARIARELHDVISHTITVIVLQAGGGRLASSTDPAAAAQALAQIEELGRDSLAELRTLLEILRSDAPEVAGTAPQPTLSDIGELCGRMRALGLPVRLRTEGETAGLAAVVQLTGYRVVQEGLTNVLKHAGKVPTEVLVDHRTSAPQLVVEVSCAPGERAVGLPGAIHGLAGLRERVDALGGRLSVGRRADGGFVVSAFLPVAERSLMGPERSGV
jgi:signal transduction histidine kinase